MGKSSALKLIVGSCVAISTLVVLFAGPLMRLFIDASETQVIFEGVRYLRIVSPFLLSDRIFILLYGLYRGIGKPQFSIVLTIISLGTRVPFGIRPFCNPGSRNCGYLVGNPNWVVPCRCSRGFLYYHFS